MASASIIAKLPYPQLIVINGRQTLFGTLQKLTIRGISGTVFKLGREYETMIVVCTDEEKNEEERKDRLVVTAKVTGESSESSIVKSVKNVWDKSEDRVALIGLGFAGVVAFWASINLIGTIDKVPIIPSAFELIGILFSSWFTYRYLLFKPDREELSRTISKSISDIQGQ